MVLRIVVGLVLTVAAFALAGRRLWWLARVGRAGVTWGTCEFRCSLCDGRFGLASFAIPVAEIPAGVRGRL